MDTEAGVVTGVAVRVPVVVTAEAGADTVDAGVGGCSTAVSCGWFC
ncbi:MAG: hypothetical protein QNJ43_10580 [Breoghania sp.]|nr:hypothetical protein [Breoghania sp.]